MSRKRRQTRTVTCPYCGEPNRAGALACRSCGADAETGWKDPEELDYQSTALPEFDDDDYERVIAELEGRHPVRGSGLPRWVIWTAILLVVVLALWFLGR